MSRAKAAGNEACAGSKSSILLQIYRAVRAETERRALPLSAEDQLLQSMSDASPTKWHRAHTSWFFEEFILKPHDARYRGFDDGYGFLFNSYYEAVGPRHERAARGLLSRPSCGDITAYRRHVDQAMSALLRSCSEGEVDALEPLVRLGLAHEEQHQELILTDILHAFAGNPLRPAYEGARSVSRASGAGGQEISFAGGLHMIGARDEVFAFDNEGPPHQAFIAPFSIAERLVTNRDWLAFMEAGGYRDPLWWHADGWSTVKREGWEAPLYWESRNGSWLTMTLGGLKPVDPDAPVCHVSFYEAAAYAAFSGKRLPTEQEWELAARQGALADAFGSRWQWTQSPYMPYPGYRPSEDALGEYNGKFMINQIVLRGSSEVTPDGHARASYRNFFYPWQRWQFSGVRFARDGGGA